MSKHLNCLIFLISFILMPALSHSAEMRVVAGYKQPISKCLKSSDTQIITQIGTFQGSQNGLAPLEVVAAAHPSSDELVTDHASVNIYENSCDLLYQQMFPGAGEVTFETLHWDKQTLLHLVTVSTVGEPADEVIYNHIILLENYDGSFMPVQPPFLTSDNDLTIFIGDIGGGRGPGIVETFPSYQWPSAHRISSFSVMFQLKHMQLPQGQSLDAFIGPTLIKPPAHIDSGSAWPDTSYGVGFPLMHYLFGKSFG